MDGLSPERRVPEMKIFFSMRHSGAIRNFESVVRGLADHGHDLHLSFVMADKIGDERIVMELANDYPGITYSWLPKRTQERWFEFARAVRFTVDLLRYRLPMYKEAHALRARAERRVPRPARWLTKLPIFRSAAFNRTAQRALIAVERAIPVDSVIEADVLSRSPDLILVTPLVDLGSDQVDYVKAAKKHGIRSALCVHSWDNLTNKGMIRVLPDRAYVWNEIQRDEAVKLHGMPADAVTVTGASTYDHWFEWQPTRDAGALKREAGLDPHRPYLLYLCSSPFIAPTEIDFIEQWIAAVRAAPDSRVREVGLLVRPHPENRQAWQRLELDELGNATVWPGQGANPVNRYARNDYFDSIHHSCGIVGINTSGLIEAGIVGRQVFTVQQPEFQQTQEGTRHFHYLTGVGGGLLKVAADLAEHTTQLSEFIAQGADATTSGREFVRQFVRPHGLEVCATDRYLDAIEAQCSEPVPAPERRGLLALPMRWLFAPLAMFMHVKSRLIKKRRKAERAARGGGLVAQTLAAPREIALRILYKFLRRKRVRAFVNRYVLPRVVGDEMAFQEVAVTERAVQRLARSPIDKIIVGPWLSEVGFEVLYWIPFLNWIRTYRDFDPERFVVISRGGTGNWYKTFTDNYLDILDFMTPEDYFRLNEERMAQGKQKQRAISEFDRDILRIAKQVLNQKDAEILHPSTMYNLFMPYWKRRATVSLVERFALFCKHPELDTSDIAGQLPDNYVAMRFYFNDSFPDTEQNREFVARLFERVTKRHEVVLLNTGIAMDDHWDFKPEELDRVHTIDHLMTPSTNLEVQTKVIQGASSFIGTYGGLSYLPPFYGVNSMALYSHRPGFLLHHLQFAQRVFMCMDDAAFTALDVRDTDLVNTLTGSDAFPTTPPRGRGKRVFLWGPGSLDNEKTEAVQARQQVPAFLAGGGQLESGEARVPSPVPVREDKAVEPKRILFVMQYPGYLRYFDSVLKQLAGRGHHVMVGFDSPHKQSEGLVCLNGTGDRIEVVDPVPARTDRYREVARGLRTTVDYSRYLHPDFVDSPYLRSRMGNVLPPTTRFLKRFPALGARSSRILTKSIGRFENGIPSPPTMEAYLKSLDLDAVVVTPLVTDGSTQVDVVKAARHLGIRSALCVASWDHLTTKGLIRLQPDRIFVWNDQQKREAVKYHHVIGYAVRITGAHPFDKWFDWEPSTSRQEFVHKVGLPAHKPYVLFVGSTKSISVHDAEVKYVLQWIRQLRGADDPTVRDVGIMIRPHPFNMGVWTEVDLSGLGDVALWPREEANPVDDQDRREYFDSLYHSAVVVGVNTTAMIEAAILDKPVHTLRTRDFQDTQGGTLHFHYLLQDNGGFVRSAADYDEHIVQLSASLADPGSAHARNAAFVRSFVRPHGPGTPCTPILARQIEVLANKQLKPRRPVPRRYLPVQAAFHLVGGVASASRRRK